MSAFHVIQIEDEVEFLMSNLEFLIEPEDAIASYNESRNMIYSMLLVNIAFEVVMSFYVFDHEMVILKQLERIYARYWQIDQFK